MKEKFEQPKAQVVRFEMRDIICTSQTLEPQNTLNVSLNSMTKLEK